MSVTKLLKYDASILVCFIYFAQVNGLNIPLRYNKDIFIYTSNSNFILRRNPNKDRVSFCLTIGFSLGHTSRLTPHSVLTNV